MANEDHHDEGKRLLGACAGGAAGLIGGGKLGIWMALTTAAIPVIGIPLASASLICAPVTGAILGAKAGRNNPTGGVFSLLMSVFIPSGSGDGGIPDGVPDVSLPDATMS